MDSTTKDDDEAEEARLEALWFEAEKSFASLSEKMTESLLSGRNVYSYFKVHYHGGGSIDEECSDDLIASLLYRVVVLINLSHIVTPTLGICLPYDEEKDIVTLYRKTCQYVIDNKLDPEKFFGWNRNITDPDDMDWIMWGRIEQFDEAVYLGLFTWDDVRDGLRCTNVLSHPKLVERLGKEEPII